MCWRCRRRGTGRLLEAALASTAENGNAAELGSAGVASALPPRYVDFKEAIRAEMVAIRQKMGELRGLHGRAALTTFDDGAGHELEIEVLTQDTTRLFRKVEARLQQFGTGDATSEADEKVPYAPAGGHAPAYNPAVFCHTCISLYEEHAGSCSSVWCQNCLSRHALH